MRGGPMCCGEYRDLRASFGTRDVPGAGDCFYHTLLRAFNEKFPARLRAVNPANPTDADIQRLRDGLAEEIQPRFDAYNHATNGSDAAVPDSIVRLFPLAWGDYPGTTHTEMQARHLGIIRTMGDYQERVQPNIEPTASMAVAAAAALWELPLTVLGPNNPADIGPEGRNPIGYLYYTGEHYMVVAPDGQPIQRAADLLPPIEEQPVDLDDDQINQMIDAYAEDVANLARSVTTLAGDARGRAEQVLAAINGRIGESPTAELVLRLSNLHRELSDFLPTEPKPRPSRSISPASPKNEYNAPAYQTGRSTDPRPDRRAQHPGRRRGPRRDSRPPRR